MFQRVEKVSGAFEHSPGLILLDRPESSVVVVTLDDFHSRHEKEGVDELLVFLLAMPGSTRQALIV